MQLSFGPAAMWAERTDVLGRLPYVLGTPWWLDADIFQQRSGQLGYDLAQVGVWIDAHRLLFPELIKGLRFDFRYRAESVDYSNVDPTLATSDVTLFPPTRNSRRRGSRASLSTPSLVKS